MIDPDHDSGFNQVLISTQDDGFVKKTTFSYRILVETYHVINCRPTAVGPTAVGNVSNHYLIRWDLPTVFM